MDWSGSGQGQLVDYVNTVMTQGVLKMLGMVHQLRNYQLLKMNCVPWTWLVGWLVGSSDTLLYRPSCHHLPPLWLVLGGHPTTVSHWPHACCTPIPSYVLPLSQQIPETYEALLMHLPPTPCRLPFLCPQHSVLKQLNILPFGRPMAQAVSFRLPNQWEISVWQSGNRTAYSAVFRFCPVSTTPQMTPNHSSIIPALEIGLLQALIPHSLAQSTTGEHKSIKITSFWLLKAK